MNKIVLIAALAIASAPALAQQSIATPLKDTRTYSQKEQARSEAEATKGYQALQREKQAETMRNKTHDGRIMIGKDTSVGGSASPPTVNVRTEMK